MDTMSETLLYALGGRDGTWHRRTRNAFDLLSPGTQQRVRTLAADGELSLDNCPALLADAIQRIRVEGLT